MGSDDELLEKIGQAVKDVCTTFGGPITSWETIARAALHAVKEAGWIPPPKPKLMADVS